MYCKRYVKTGLPHTKCTRCHGSGELVVQEKDQAPETVKCEGCHGRGFDIIVQTIDRARCPTCKEDCDAKDWRSRSCSKA
jgi:DnaJ-class molecular chaperone